MDKNFYSRLTEILPEDRIKEEEPMRLHTTFRVGGPARFFVMPKTAEELQGSSPAAVRHRFPTIL